MADEKTELAVIDGETLMDMKLPPTKFCVDTLLPQGLCILGGASKIGKSWWVLDLCAYCKGRTDVGVENSRRNNAVPLLRGYAAPCAKPSALHHR